MSYIYTHTHMGLAIVINFLPYFISKLALIPDMSRKSIVLMEFDISHNFRDPLQV